MLLTFILACLGTAVLSFAELPLPFLFGPMIACLIAAFAGMKLSGFGQVALAGRMALGLAVGVSITPALLYSLPEIALSIAIIPLYILVIGCIGFPFFHRVCGYDVPTAYYSAMPGGLQDMVLFGIEAGGNARTLSLIHATRLLLIVTLAPIVLTQFFDVGLTKPIGVPVDQIAPQQLLLMFGAGLFGWKFGERMGLFGASILGPMIVAALLALGGILNERPPKEAILCAQFLIGTAIGVHYMGITWREFRQVIVAGVTFVGILAALAAFLAVVIQHFAPIGKVEAFLSFAPGGQAEMTILAIVVGADLGVVIAHHLVRVVLVITCAPIVARWVKRDEMLQD